MAKISFSKITNANTLSVINDNFSKLQQELQERVAYRDNPQDETNTIKNPLDLDGNDILNVSTVSAADVLIGGENIKDLLSGGDYGYSEEAKDAAAQAVLAKDQALIAAANAQNVVIDVKTVRSAPYNAKGDNVTNDTTAFILAKADSAASGNTTPIKVPAGKYRVDSTFDFGSTLWQFDMGAVIVDSATGDPFQGSMNGVALPVALSNSAPIRKGRISSPAVDFQVANTNAGSNTGLRDDQMFYQKWYDGTVDVGYTLGTSNIYTFTQYGQIKGAQGLKASGSAANLAGAINVFAVGKGETGTGRSEITPLAYAVNCFEGYSQAGANFYFDWNVAGPISGNVNEREGFLAGASIGIKKFTPGNGIDADHDGSYGVSICHVPGAGGFGHAGQNSVRTYPAKAGIAIVGYSGLPSVAHAKAANADMGYEVGVQIGGDGGSVWLNPTQKVSGSTMVGTGIYLNDWLYNGINIAGKHPYAGSLAPAIAVAPSAGPTLLGLNETSVQSRLVVKGYPEINSPAVLLSPDTSTSSRRVAVQIGNAVVGQDISGNGTLDFFIFAANGLRIRIDQSGNVIMPSLPTSATGLPSGALWRNGTVVNIVP